MDKLRDVTEFLAGIDFNCELGTLNMRATYQDPCHLGHAQRVRSAPRKLLSAIPGLELIELKEADICCGSAGRLQCRSQRNVRPIAGKQNAPHR